MAIYYRTTKPHDLVNFSDALKRWNEANISIKPSPSFSNQALTELEPL